MRKLYLNTSASCDVVMPFVSKPCKCAGGHDWSTADTKPPTRIDTGNDWFFLSPLAS